MKLARTIGYCYVGPCGSHSCDKLHFQSAKCNMETQKRAKGDEKKQ